MMKAKAADEKKNKPMHTCKICGHEWQQRLAKTPARCGKCKSPYWNVGYTYKGKKKE